MTDRTYQNFILRLRASCGEVFGVIDREGTVIACSDETQLGSLRREAAGIQHAAEINGSIYTPLPMVTHNGAAVFMDSTGRNAEEKLAMIAGFFGIVAGGESGGNARNNCIRQLLFSAETEADIYTRLRELNINNDVPHSTAVIRCGKENNARMQRIISSILLDRTKDFILLSPGEDLVVVREERKEENLPEVWEAFLQDAEKQYRISCTAGIGTTVNDLVRLPESLKAAEYAANAASLRMDGRKALTSEDAGIEGLAASVREEDLIYFEKQMAGLKNADDETIHMIQRFLANNLDVTGTAQELFINRNTLVYRLKRIENETGYDLKKFGDAMKVCLAMVIFRRNGDTRWQK